MKFKLSDKTASVKLAATENETEYYSVEALSPNENLRIEWAEPMTGHYSVWHPMCGRGRQLPQWFCAHKAESCFYKGAPVIATLSRDGKNRVCVSFSDTSVPLSMGFYVDDFNQRGEVIFTLDIRIDTVPFSAVLRIDRRNIPFADAVSDVALWWNDGIIKRPPPEARSPLYSSWYNFHQNPRQAELTDELKTASELGFGTFILDDGWQIEGEGTKDYLLSGDWQVAKDKFPDFRKFVSDVHSFGMKFILWFAVPFAGFKTETYKRFRNKMLFEQSGFINAGILDIRYPEVREYITGTYCRFIRDYDIDGLKLDFIDNFKCYEETPPFGDGMDCETVEKAVVKLLEEIQTSVESLKQGFLFEYRQFYIGPSILKFGNMIRVADCALDSLTNRIGVADLRLTTCGAAVHSDMLLWSPGEEPVNCAMQLINVMFSAVQISVLLNNSTPLQKEIIKAFTAYSEENREVLQEGRFSVKHPELNYTALSSENKCLNRRITALYAEQLYEYGGMTEDVWNGTASENAVIINSRAYNMKITVRDFTGNVLNRIFSKEPVVQVAVPPTGMIKIERV